MIAGMTVRKRQPNHDKIDKTKLQIARGSVRGAAATDAGCDGNGGGVSSTMPPF